LIFFHYWNTILNMKKDIDEITKSFAPKISHTYVRNYFRIDFETEINNDSFYSKMEELTSKAYPSSLPCKKQSDTRWEYFYLPMKRKGRLICTPIWVLLYQSLYYVWFYGINSSSGNLVVDKGNDELFGDYNLFIDEAIRFIPLMKETDNKIVERTYPYDYRVGKIRKKYFYNKEKLMPESERNEIETAYKKHLEKKLTLGEISLNDYLNTAAICYRGAFKEKSGSMTPREMYHGWADNRHFGMLDIDPDNKKEFTKWLITCGSRGSHPFEIVYSPVNSGIHLYPPEEEYPFYRLSVANKYFTEIFIRMAVTLVEHKVPFETFCMTDSLDYLTGESFVDVNGSGIDTFYYSPSRENREKYFPHIQWKEIKVLKWK
jgi:hypothetical protein